MIINNKIRGLLVECGRLQGYGIVPLDEYLPTFQRVTVLSPSERSSQIKYFSLDCLNLEITALCYFETSELHTHDTDSHRIRLASSGNTALRTKNHTCDC